MYVCMCVLCVYVCFICVFVCCVGKRVFVCCVGKCVFVYCGYVYIFIFVCCVGMCISMCKAGVNIKFAHLTHDEFAINRLCISSWYSSFPRGTVHSLMVQGYNMSLYNIVISISFIFLYLTLITSSDCIFPFLLFYFRRS